MTFSAIARAPNREPGGSFGPPISFQE